MYKKYNLATHLVLYAFWR